MYVEEALAFRKGNDRILDRDVLTGQGALVEVPALPHRWKQLVPATARNHITIQNEEIRHGLVHPQDVHVAIEGSEREV